MEHLPLPSDVAAPGPSAVPYLCKEEYDGGPFLTYPSRRGNLGIPTADKLVAATDFAWVLRISLSELEAFLQTWLFFGLLKEILGDVFDSSQYVIVATEASPQPGIAPISSSWPSNSSKREVNTSKLVPAIKVWMKQVKDSSASRNERQTEIEHIGACLTMVSDVLQAVVHSKRSDLNPLIQISIASVCELVQQATYEVYGSDKFSKDNHSVGTWPLFYIRSRNAVQIRENGLCPYEVHRVQNLSLTLSSYHYLTWMKRDMPSIRHASCTASECRANQIAHGSYKTKHRDASCKCIEFSVDVPEVIRILSRGSLPLIHIRPGKELKDLRVDVVEATPSVAYVALSHIWADGLGNPYSNALPRCQLQLLSQLIRPLLTMPEASARDQDTYLWIDTLCCPVKPPEAKDLALRRMKEPYTEAAHVLVLDSSLRGVNTSSLDPIEICMRIFTSGWMRRLWTLQEGALPQNLWFQFEDRVLDLQEIWLEVARIGEIGKKAIVLDISVLYRGLRCFFHADKDDGGVDLASVDQALQFRSVSVPSDEPLLIGGLLNLDISYILGDSVEIDTRMSRLWSMMPSAPGGIPKNILFARGARVDQLGFRWAPASLLVSRGVRDGNLRSRDPNSKGCLTPAGLQVRLAACTIQMASTPKSLPKNPWNMFSKSDDNSTYCRSGSGLWFQIYTKYRGKQDRNASGAHVSLLGILRNASRSHMLLFSGVFDFDGSPEGTKGLLVHGAGEQDGVPKVVSDLIVEVEIKVGATKTLLEAAYQISQRLLADSITARYISLAIEDEQSQKNHPAYATLEDQLAEKLFSLVKDIDDPQILEALNTSNSSGIPNLLPLLTASAYLGNYCEVGPMMPGDTEWCID